MSDSSYLRCASASGGHVGRGAERLDDRAVGRQQRLVAELLRTHPLERLTFKPGRHPLIVLDDEYLELDAAIRVLMLQPQQPMTAAQRDPELLMELAGERQLGALTGPDLAARKFP